MTWMRVWSARIRSVRCLCFTGSRLFDLVIVMGTAAEMCRQEVMDTLRADKTRRTRVFVISWPQSEQMVRSMYRMGVNQYMTLPVSLHRLRRKVINELIDREKWK